MNLPLEFHQCPNCKSKETVCRLACANEPSAPKGGVVVSFEEFAPLQDVSKLLGPTIRAVVAHYDVCAKCGTRYCIKAEMTNLPVMVQQVQMPSKNQRFQR